VIARRLASVAALTLVVASGVAGHSSAATRGPRPSMSKLEGEIMCPTCHTTLDQSDASIALRIEAFMRRRIAAGATESQIKAELVAQFGTAILASPPKRGFDLLAWVLPLAGIAGAGALITMSMRRWRREDAEEIPLQVLDLASEALVDAALAEFDRQSPAPIGREGAGPLLRPLAPSD
jgi:cytochrome c-type biogenesis protein CcmH/NrfF